MAIYRGQSRYYHLVVYKERKIANDPLIRVTNICQLEEKFGGVAALKKKAFLMVKNTKNYLTGRG